MLVRIKIEGQQLGPMLADQLIVMRAKTVKMSGLAGYLYMDLQRVDFRGMVKLLVELRRVDLTADYHTGQKWEDLESWSMSKHLRNVQENGNT